MPCCLTSYAVFFFSSRRRHTRCSRDWSSDVCSSDLDGAIFGFGVETGMHLLRLITIGIFDRYPDLQIMVGHAGEALPYWAYRLDYMHQQSVRSKRYERMKPLKKTILEYLRSNVLITTSGM